MTRAGSAIGAGGPPGGLNQILASINTMDPQFKSATTTSNIARMPQIHPTRPKRSPGEPSSDGDDATTIATSIASAIIAYSGALAFQMPSEKATPQWVPTISR